MRLINPLGKSESRGTKESKSLHSMFRAGSLNALHVLANLANDLLPFGESIMNSSSLLVTSASLRISWNMMFWFW